MKTVYILFGEMGSGKSYLGQKTFNILSSTRNGPAFLNNTPIVKFLEGDSLVGPEMMERVSKFKPIPREYILKFISTFANAIADEMETCDDLIVSQALYFDEDRQFIDMFLKCLGYNVIWYWVKPPFWRNLKQIFSRKQGFRWVIYWLMNKPFFQKPTHSYILT